MSRPKNCCHPFCENCPYLDCVYDEIEEIDKNSQNRFDKELQPVDPDVLKRRLRQKKYEASEKGKARIKRYLQSEKGIEAVKKYNQSEGRKQSQRRYSQSEKGKETQRRYRQSEKGRLAEMRKAEKKRQKRQQLALNN